MRECSRPVEAEVVSNSRNKLHQTWGPWISRSLYLVLSYSYCETVRTSAPIQLLLKRVMKRMPLLLRNHSLPPLWMESIDVTVPPLLPACRHLNHQSEVSPPTTRSLTHSHTNGLKIRFRGRVRPSSVRPRLLRPRPEKEEKRRSKSGRE